MMKKTPLALIIVFSLVNTIVFAQTKPPASVVLIKAGRLIDVCAGRVIENQGILVEGERIKAVGPIPYRTIQATVAARTGLWNGFTVMRDLETEGAISY